MEFIAKAEEKHEKHPWGQRQVQTFLLFICMAIAYALRVNLSVGIVVMTNNSIANKNFVEFSWDGPSKSLILSSFFWGYLVTQIYGGQMAEKYGGKYFLVGAIGVSGVLTIMTPWSAIHGGILLMCANRMIQGMAQGFIFPTLSVLLSKWAPAPEKSRLISFVFSGSKFGSMVMLATSGFLADSAGGWPAIFYVSGIVALIWIIFWCLLGSNGPEEHPSINEKERQFIIDSLSKYSSRKHLKTPWNKIIKSIPMWSLLVVHMAQNWGFWILLTNIPTYINYILKFNIKSNGFLSAMPYFIMWVLIMVFSWISDYINLHGLMSNTHQKKMWNSIAQWGAALALMALCLDTSPTIAIILLNVALGLNSAIVTGFMTSHIDLAPNFAGTLMGITNSFSNVTSILGPLIVGFIVKDVNNKTEWNTAFTISAGIFFLGNLIYIIFGSAEVQPWNDLSKTNKTQTLSKEDNSEKP
ncbi:Major facilitator superfamily,Major facilitator superfamily domain [Cinara cedri]|uniref:Putative inorganic phosphate cotransporter n=1 Tax=Cinara cedri TaxID=506608 RepID=A0A5E4NLC9_9HEMI|nr:Major facilitator superfamily,Major facilitator superfamily domain [Cinara cedri]